ncbi:NAD(P)-dependent dehydrogenase (short-subunit alcohol dehydrogenase family) [Dyadobacter jejuensis]|uniref:NAD(P)-dependent dehydrogenase (Short-subunit alcohol dehydrogenase family) n=1 Tax=Dyadobacter jejuensis TaxID=1082580 RepID=A0A316ARF6_9BACT|nr:SDR family NAD(P)-dependent oxidoreductase [Dyadobacter jejuensis]PWJ59410.1 NAD(P)-dependent dehydrogenase (short-subunit alcohol dehydrogenase family) [Dyadobacter jejuensis]
MHLRNSNVLITGGASGLGEATARLALHHGARVCIVDLDELGKKTIEHKYHDRFLSIIADVTSETDIKLAMEEMVAKFGSIDVVVNCAGIAPVGKTVGKQDGIYGPHDLALFEKTVKINLFGSFNVARLTAFAMEQNPTNECGERGVIIHTSSIAAYDGQMGQIAYAASKGAIASMTLPMARDLSRAGIRVMTIAPGLFETPLLASLPREARQSLGQQVPFPARLGKPAEYALLVKAIVENPMLNGEVIRLDGALRMGPR